MAQLHPLFCSSPKSRGWTSKRDNEGVTCEIFQLTSSFSIIQKDGNRLWCLLETPEKCTRCFVFSTGNFCHVLICLFFSSDKQGSGIIQKRISATMLANQSGIPIFILLQFSWPGGSLSRLTFWCNGLIVSECVSSSTLLSAVRNSNRPTVCDWILMRKNAGETGNGTPGWLFS